MLKSKLNEIIGKTKNLFTYKNNEINKVNIHVFIFYLKQIIIIEAKNIIFLIFFN